MAPAASALSRAASRRPDVDPAARSAEAGALLQAGRSAEALRVLEALLADHPGHADALNNTAIALAQLGRFDEAIARFRHAAAADPKHADAHHNLGLVLHQHGRFDEASDAFTRSLALHPTDAIRWVDAGNSHLEAQRAAEALHAYDEALRRDPHCISALSNRALALRALLRLPEAEAACRAAISIAPDHVDAWSNLGLMLINDDRLEEGGDALGRALALAPDSVVVGANRCGLHLRTGRRIEALALAEQLVATHPRAAEAWNALGHAQMELGRHDDALSSCERALDVAPADRTAPFNRATVLLLRGDFAAGLDAYEARRYVTSQLVHIRRAAAPEWDGRPLHGETVLLTAEQGVGDTLQFVRYAMLLKNQGAGRVIVEAPRGVATLIGTAPGVDEVVNTDAPLPPCDFQVPLLSLPRLFGTRLESIPAAVPYLTAPERPIAELVRAAPGLRVGIVWSGNPRQNRNRVRSVPFALMLQALEQPGVSLFSLQVGGGTDPVFDDAVRAQRITDLAPAIKDYFDTAAAVAACDVVVSVCTSVAHLAGALARPTFTLLAYVADWRWLQDRSDSPWYPTMHLLRQDALDDWSAPLGALRDALAARRIASSETPVVQPRKAPHQAPLIAPAQVTAPRTAAFDLPAAFRRATALHATGQRDLALAAYDDLLRRSPAHGESLNNSAILLAERGDRAAAEQRVRAAIASNAGYGQAHYNLALMLRTRREVTAALDAYAKAVACEPTRAAWWLDYANCAAEFVQHETALVAYDRALALEPNNATIMADRALALRGTMRRDEAIAACEAALRVDPRNGSAYANLALFLKEVRRWEEAEQAFHAGLALLPDHPVLLANLSAFYLEQGRTDRALEVSNQLVAAHPEKAEGHNGRGCVFFERGALDAARAEFEAARARDASNPNAAWNLTTLALLHGDLANGLRGFEHRRSMNAFVFQSRERPGLEWDGKALHGRTVFVHEEQGLGDLLQFVRYAGELKRRGAGRVIIEAPADAARLLATAPGVDGVSVRGAPLPAYDVFVPLMSLPYRCETSLESIPRPASYLRVDEQAAERDAARIVRQATGALKVGIIWGGNPNHQRDRYRSMPFVALFSAAQVDGVSLFSLQKGPHADELAAWSKAAGLVDLAPHLQSLDDTAAAVMELDLVITVDTAMAHLAAALGRPTWTLVTRVPDWRWLLDRTDTPWYPTMRLFRQQASEDWSRPLGEVRAALLELRTQSPAR